MAVFGFLALAALAYFHLHDAFFLSKQRGHPRVAAVPPNRSASNLGKRKSFLTEERTSESATLLDCWVYNKPFKTGGSSIAKALVTMNTDRGGIAAPDDLEHFLGPSSMVVDRILQLGKIDFFWSHIRMSDEVVSAFRTVCRGKLTLMTSIREPVGLYFSWYMQQRESLYPGSDRVVQGGMKEISYRMWLATANRFLIMDYMDGRSGESLPVDVRVNRIADLYDNIIVFEKFNSSFLKLCQNLTSVPCPAIGHVNERGTNFSGIPSYPTYVAELKEVSKFDKILYEALLSKS